MSLTGSNTAYALLGLQPGIAQPSGKDTPKKTDRVIVFVLGGPGSGKGTQVSTFPFLSQHLSVLDQPSELSKTFPLLGAAIATFKLNSTTVHK